MRFLTRLAGVCAAFTLMFASGAGAGSLVLTFPEPINPPSFSVAGPFPQPGFEVGNVTFEIPTGQRVIAATISGFWGTTALPEATAGVDVFVDNVVVASCVKPASGCWEQHSGQQPWSYIFKEEDLAALADGKARMTAIQTSEFTVRLGVSTLIVQLGPAETVPALSPLALVLLSAMLGLAALSTWRVRRRRS